MATPAQLVEALHDWGCDPVPFRSGWTTHNRGDDWRPVGVTHHHTGGSAKLLTSSATQEAMRRLLWIGRITDDPATTLHGPLCHNNISMVGDTGRARVYLIGWGIANHAGKGSSRTLALVRAGKYDGQRPGSSDTNGNPVLGGFEYSHPGTDLEWPDALLECGHRAHCAWGEVFGWPRDEWPGRAIEHREWTTRKIDRSWSGDLRAAIRAASLEGEDMATPQENWSYDIDTGDTKDGKPVEWDAQSLLRQAYRHARNADSDAGQALAAVKALSAKVDGINAGGVTDEQLTRVLTGLIPAIADAVNDDTARRLKD